MKTTRPFHRTRRRFLQRAGVAAALGPIITDRTIHIYAAWVDVEGLQAEGETMVGDAIAAEGIDYLRAINAKRRVIGQKVSA